MLATESSYRGGGWLGMYAGMSPVEAASMYGEEWLYCVFAGDGTFEMYWPGDTTIICSGLCGYIWPDAICVWVCGESAA